MAPRMRYRQSSVGKLEKVSLRLSFGLLVSLLLLVFFAVAGYWVTYKVIRGEVLKVDYHFMRFVGRAYDHEIFLLRAIKASSQLEYKPVFNSEAYVVNETTQGNMRIYEGQASQVATTFSAALPIKSADADDGVLAQQLHLGIALANVYGDFWSGSTFTSPQMFLFDLSSDFDIAIPAISPQGYPGQRNFSQVLEEVKRSARQLPPLSSDLLVRWRPSHFFLGGEDIQQILGYVSGRVEEDRWERKGPPKELIAATLLYWDEFDAPGVRIEKQFFDLPLYSDVDIIAPDGTRVVGGKSPQIYQYESGFHFTLSGLLIKRSAGDMGAWQALYRIPYIQLVQDAHWQLLGLVGLLGLCVISGWSVIRWYRRRIVGPASDDFRELLVNHDFNLSLLQTVPLALCVVKGPQIELVTQNSLYAQWLGEPTGFANLMALWPLFEQDQPLTGEGCLLVDQRALHVRYTPTEYLGDSVLLCTFTDISSHREASASLLFARQAADAANQQKSDFVATLSHELRTPLYGVLGTLELLGMTSLDERQLGYLRTIDGSSAVLMRLISDVLDLSKIEAGQMVLESVAFQPLEMLEETVRGFSAMAANKGLALYCCVDPRVPNLVQGDRLRIQQIVGNLLNNAIKFTRSGHVAVALSPIGFSSGKVSLQWCVIDSGPGMSDAVQAQLFERFYQADSKHHTVAGTGLGLPICAHLSQMMGGALSVDSVPGEGSTFIFELALEALEARRSSLPQLSGKCIDVRTPYATLTDNLCAWLEWHGAYTIVMGDDVGVAPDAVLTVMPQEVEVGSSGAINVFAQHDFSSTPQFIGQDVTVNQNSVRSICRALVMAITGESEAPLPQAPVMHLQLDLNVLVAEDNPVNQVLMKEQLERIGCTVDVVSDGGQALRQLEFKVYDVLLTDVNMPLMDGYELADTLRQQDVDMPIIGVTANALREEGEHCIRVGMNSWLSKPIDIQGLYLCLRSVLDPTQIQASPGAAQANDLDEINVPERMLELFLETIAQDLAELKALDRSQGRNETVRLLHRIRGALAVGKAKSLIQLSRELEVAVARDGLVHTHADVAVFIQRVERSIANVYA
ncbi:response regulator [Pseudomonas edaphica]|uniref:hybrid sensor histidine kinase/response regulator n=1 Tax=Pseudomonas edaphica TaxID=2006980 RepID=UPI003D0B36F7